MRVKILKTYNTFMYKLNCLLIIVSIAITPMFAFADTTTAADAKVEANMAAQVATCKANTAMEWSSSLNRCVGKVEARATRNDSKACNAIEDVKAREQCHIKVAEKSTGLSADVEKLNTQGGTTGSMMMNGSIAAAYSIITLISKFGSKKSNNNCTSKHIMGVTSLAGLASDAYLKISAKKKVKELEDKYALDKTSSAYEAQVKALEYLKEEQQTVAKIASLEKKRNLALMLGYGVAAGFAVYEMTFPSENAPCYTDPDQVPDGPTITATPDLSSVQASQL